jgi:hypothetical protein
LGHFARECPERVAEPEPRYKTSKHDLKSNTRDNLNFMGPTLAAKEGSKRKQVGQENIDIDTVAREERYSDKRAKGFGRSAEASEVPSDEKGQVTSMGADESVNEPFKVVGKSRVKQCRNMSDGICIKGSVENVPIVFTANTGASKSVISFRVYNKISKDKKPIWKLSMFAKCKWGANKGIWQSNICDETRAVGA